MKSGWLQRQTGKVSGLDINTLLLLGKLEEMKTPFAFGKDMEGLWFACTVAGKAQRFDSDNPDDVLSDLIISIIKAKEDQCTEESVNKPLQSSTT